MGRSLEVYSTSMLEHMHEKLAQSKQKQVVCLRHVCGYDTDKNNCHDQPTTSLHKDIRAKAGTI